MPPKPPARRTPLTVVPGRAAVSTAPAGMAAATLTPRTRVVVAIALAVAWSILFFPQLFQGKAFVMGDARHYRPFAEFSRSRWESLHQRTHWNPYLLAGLPATASLADNRPQYLPDAALDLYERVRIGRVVPMGAPLFAHLAGMLATAWLVRRAMGAGALGMVFAGIAWGWIPDLVVPLAFGQDAKVVTMSLMPVALLATHALIAGEDRHVLRGAVLMSLTLGVMVLTGHPQFVVYAGLVVAAFALVTALSQRRAGRLWWVLWAGGLGGVMSAAVWLPAMLYGAHSFRGGGGVPLDEVRSLSFAWRDLLSLGWPQAVGWGGPSYWGGLGDTDYARFVGASVLALAGVATVRGGLRSALDRLWAGLAVFGMVFSIGAHLGPLYTLLSNVLPFAARFRVASAVLCVAELSLVVLAARAFAPTGSAPPPKPGLAKPLAIGIGAALLLAALALAFGPLADTYVGFAIGGRPGMPGSLAVATAHQAGFDLILRIVLAAVAVVLLAATRRTGPVGTAAAVAMIAVVGIDLGSTSIPAARRATGPAAALQPMPPSELARIGAAHPSTRVWSTRRMPPTPEFPDTAVVRYEAFANDWIAWRARGLAGDHGAPPSFWRTLRQVQPTPGSVSAMGVTYVSAEPGAVVWDSTLFLHVASAPREEVYEIRNALGRAYAVPQVTAPGSEAEILAKMSAPDFKPHEEAFANDPAVAGSYPGSRGTRIGWIRDDPDTLALTVDAPDRAYVVIADSDVPGWTARLDGNAVAIHRTNQLGRGIVVPAGSHRLDLTYVPEGWTRGVLLTRTGLLVWIVAAIAALVMARMRRPPVANAA